MSMHHDSETAPKTSDGERAFSNPETLCEEVEAYITEKPFQSLAIALLAGIIVGKIIL